MFSVEGAVHREGTPFGQVVIADRHTCLWVSVAGDHRAQCSPLVSGRQVSCWGCHAAIPWGEVRGPAGSAHRSSVDRRAPGCHRGYHRQNSHYLFAPRSSFRMQEQRAECGPQVACPGTKPGCLEDTAHGTPDRPP